MNWIGCVILHDDGNGVVIDTWTESGHEADRKLKVAWEPLAMRKQSVIRVSDIAGVAQVIA